MDSGCIRHFKCLLRKRLRQENGGRRQVLNKELMFKICEQVWNGIPVEDFRPYMTKTADNWKEIRKWVGWSGRGKNVRHGQGH